MSFKSLVFIIVLIFSVSIVEASISVRYISGSAGVSAFRMSNDTVILNITSTYGSLKINNNNLSCNNEGNNYVCAYMDIMNVETINYAIKNNMSETATATIKVDNSIGTVDFNVMISNGSVLLLYTLTDTGFNNAAACTGILSFDVYDGTNGPNTYIVNGTSTKCSLTGNVTLPITDSGNKTMRIVGKDNVGNTKSSILKNIIIDLSMPEIRDLTIKSYNTELTTVATNTDLPVDISFNIIEDNIQTITADLSSINTNNVIKQAYRNIVVSPSSCSLNLSPDNRRMYSCVIRNKVLRVNNDFINISVKVADTSGNIKTEVLDKTFTIDNDRPTATVSTDFCDDNTRCYLKNGPNKINVHLSKTNFNNKNVFIDVNNRVMRVTNCTGGDCFGEVYVTGCPPNSAVLAKLAGSPYVSQDDAGNKLQSFSNQLYCDNDPPYVMLINFSGYYSDPQLNFPTLIFTGSQVNIYAKVQDISGKLYANATLNQLKNSTESAQCVKNSTNNLFNCSWSITNIEPGSYDARIDFLFVDAAGNRVDRSERVKVFKLRADNETPDVLKIEPLGVLPQSIDRITLDLANVNKIPYFAYVNYKLNAKNPSQRIQLISQKISASNCIFQDADTDIYFTAPIFADVRIADTYNKALGSINRLDFEFAQTVDVNALPNNMIAYCNLSVYVRVGNEVYRNPQSLILQMPFSFRNAKLGTPGDAIQRKIDDLQKGFFYKDEVLGIVNEWLPRIQSLCEIKNYASVAQFAGTIVNIALTSITPSFMPSGAKEAGFNFVIDTSQIAECFYDSGEIKVQATGNIPAGGAGGTGGTLAQSGGSILLKSCKSVIKTICQYASCSIAEKANVTPTPPLTDIFEPGQIWNNALAKNLQLPDVSNSILMAAYYQCWPAVIYNVNKYRQIECSYVYCLKETSRRGVDISICDKSKSIQYCSLVVGEIFELPGVRVGKNFMNNLRELINNIGPLTVVSAAKHFYCEEYMSTDPKYVHPGDTATNKYDSTKVYVCQIPLAIARFVDGMKRSTRAEQFYYPPIPDMCTLAKCMPGEPCDTGGGGIWATLGAIAPPSGGERNPQYAANHNQIVEDKRLLFQAQYTQLNDNQRAWYQSVVRSPEQYNTLMGAITQPFYSGLSLSDLNALLSQHGITLPPGDSLGAPAGITDRTRNLFNLDNDVGKEVNRANCGKPVCDHIDFDKPLEQQKEILNQLDPEERARLQQDEDNKRFAALERYQNYDQQLKDLEDEMNKGEITGAEYNTKKSQLEERKKLEAIAVNGCTGPECLVVNMGEQQVLLDAHDRQVDADRARELGGMVDMALRLLYQNHVLDWMMTSEWSNGLMKVTQFLDPETWKMSVCNPDVNIIGDSGSDSGTTIICEQGICRPALTMGAEYEEVNLINGSEYYLYTTAYYLGPITLRSGDTITYNIEFRGPQGNVKTYRTDQTLNDNDVIKFAKTFAHKKKLDKMCIVFSDPFPPYQIAGKREYCRTIRPGDFDTGTPHGDDNVNNYLNPAASAANQPTIFTGGSGEYVYE